MEIRFNITGAERKELVTAISGITGVAPVYKKAPTFAYVVHNYTIDKNGTLSWDERVDAGDALNLLTELAERGYVSEDASGLDADAEADIAGNTSIADASAENISGGYIPDADAFAGDGGTMAGDPVPETPADGDSGSLTIEIPLPGFTDADFDKLERLVASKAALIKKAVSASDLAVEREGDNLCFSWFTPGSSPGEVAAYTQFVAALCDMAKKQKRVVAKEKPADSEKFAFRCFLLRLGFIGDAYASARKILLANLPGDGSFKSGKRREQGAPAAAHAVFDSGSDTDAAAAETGGHAADSLAEALADAELIHNVNMSFEQEGVADDGGDE